MSARPKIKVEMSKVELGMHFLALCAVITAVVLLLTSYADLPDRIPIHFNFAGEVDGWGSKSSTLWMLGLGAVMYIGLFVLSLFPHTFNFPGEVTEENAPRLYYYGRMWMSVLNTAMLWLFVGIFALAVTDAENGFSNAMGFIIGACVALTALTIAMCVHLSKLSQADSVSKK